MPWLMVLAAGALEMVWSYSAKQSNGFANWRWVAVTMVASAASFFLLTFSLKTLPLGTAYSVWTGIGAIGSFVVGVLLLGESFGTWRVFSALLILAGVVGLSPHASSMMVPLRRGNLAVRPRRYSAGTPLRAAAAVVLGHGLSLAAALLVPSPTIAAALASFACTQGQPGAIVHMADLPPALQETLHNAARGGIADPGQRFQVTDVIMLDGPRLPANRLICAYPNAGGFVMEWEYGSIAHGRNKAECKRWATTTNLGKRKRPSRSA